MMSDHQTKTHNPNAAKNKWFLLIENPTKSNHLGTLLRCSAAFQCHQVLLVGYEKFNCQGSFGSHMFLDIVAFHCWDAAMEYLKGGACLMTSNNQGFDDISCREASAVNDTQHKEKISIVGILGACGGGDEVFSPEGMNVYNLCNGYVSLNHHPNEQPDDDHTQKIKQSSYTCLPHKSYPIHTRPFSTHTCFLVSKSRNGLPADQAQLCDGFVHIPHLNIFDDTNASSNNEEPITTAEASSKSINNLEAKQSISNQATPLLDTATTFSITLHHFTAWSGYTERQFEENQKFVKDDRPNRVRYLGVGKSYYKKEEMLDHGNDDGQESNMVFWKSDCSGDY